MSPFPGLENELSLFGQFVGDWEIVDRSYEIEGGRIRSTRGELHWGWILGGRATQDVWIAYDRETSEVDQMGTTIRFYDAEARMWKSIWASPMHNTVMVFTGGQVGDDIVLEHTDDSGERSRWIFYDIRPDSFSWRAEVAAEDSGEWRTSMRMKIRKAR